MLIFACSQEDPAFESDTLHCDFSRDELEVLLTYENEYKRCYLNIETWFSAVAEVIEPGDDKIDRIHINQQRNLGRAFDKDEVVVRIDKGVSITYEVTYMHILRWFIFKKFLKR